MNAKLVKTIEYVNMRLDDERRQMRSQIKQVMDDCAKQLARLEAGERASTWMDGSLQCVHNAKDANESALKVRALEEQLAMLNRIAKEEK